MRHLSLHPGTLDTWGGVLSLPTMLFAAVVDLDDESKGVSIFKRFNGKLMLDVITQVQKDPTQAIVGLLIATPPHVNRTPRWSVDIISDFGRATIRDRAGAQFTTYAYRTSSGLVFIDNALPEPSYIRNWKSRVRLSSIASFDETQNPEFQSQLAARLTELVNDLHLPH